MNLKNLFMSGLLLMLFALAATAQNTRTQTIQGRILDKASEMPLIGATVEWLEAETPVGAISDEKGNYSLEGVGLGRQTLRISYLGYETTTIPNVVVTSGKQVVMDIQLSESVESLQELVVKATVEKDKTQNEMATISARTFSVEEVNRFSGGRSDVARLAGNFAGVATSNDARNDIVIRGNSPTGLLWRLEGIPIPNPNHYSTLGTTGGPVSALNPNLLSNSDFLTSAFPAEYGNALSGVFDIGFRSGNREKNEFMVQLGAISGLEGMAEGPMLKKQGGSYMVSARYSFVGVASKMGWNIGTNATPDYKDVAFKLDFGQSKAGRFTLFGLVGLSDIAFYADEVDENDLFSANDEDSFAESQVGVVGLKHNLILDKNTYLRTVIAGTQTANAFYVDRYFNKDTQEEEVRKLLDVDNQTNTVAFSTYVNRKFSSKFTGRAGLLTETQLQDLFTQTRYNTPDFDGDGKSDWIPTYDFEGNTTMWQPFAQGQWTPARDWTVTLGVHGQYLGLNDTWAVEPRTSINWRFLPGQSLSVGYGLHSQSQVLPILLLKNRTAGGEIIETNRDLKFSQSHQFVMGYDVKLGGDWRLKSEAYYQLLRRIPVDPTPSSFSMLNFGSDFAFPDDAHNLVNDGTGTNYGLEVTLEKFFSRGYYGLLTGSLFESKYKGSDGVERNTAFNNKYVLNALFGKEWSLGTNDRMAITFDTKFTTAGGRFYTPVDLEASRLRQEEVRLESKAYSEQFDEYLRWDVKFGFRLNSPKRKLTQTLYFDIQNVTNRENIFIQRYNRLTNEVNNVNQIGFFPDFLYRVTF